MKLRVKAKLGSLMKLCSGGSPNVNALNEVDKKIANMFYLTTLNIEAPVSQDQSLQEMVIDETIGTENIASNDDVKEIADILNGNVQTILELEVEPNGDLDMGEVLAEFDYPCAINEATVTPSKIESDPPADNVVTTFVTSLYGGETSQLCEFTEPHVNEEEHQFETPSRGAQTTWRARGRRTGPRTRGGRSAQQTRGNRRPVRAVRGTMRTRGNRAARNRGLPVRRNLNNQVSLLNCV